MKKLQLFYENHGLSPLKKCQFCVHFKSMFILSRKACLQTRTSPHTFSRSILHKKKTLRKFPIFDQNHGLSPWKNANFMGFWNRCFHCPERLVCYIKGRRSFFHDLFSRSITREYRGLPGVTWGYRGLHWVTRGYRRLQGVTGGYKGLQKVTSGYRGLQRTIETFF